MDLDWSHAVVGAVAALPAIIIAWRKDRAKEKIDANEAAIDGLNGVIVTLRAQVNDMGDDMAAMRNHYNGEIIDARNAHTKCLQDNERTYSENVELRRTVQKLMSKLSLIQKGESNASPSC